MQNSAISLRKFAEALNCINESSVYEIEITPMTISIYKYHELVHEFTTQEQGIVQAYEYFVSEIRKYLKDGGWVE